MLFWKNSMDENIESYRIHEASSTRNIRDHREKENVKRYLPRKPRFIENMSKRYNHLFQTGFMYCGNRPKEFALEVIRQADAAGVEAAVGDDAFFENGQIDPNSWAVFCKKKQ
jgi:hypothetical protein